MSRFIQLLKNKYVLSVTFLRVSGYVYMLYNPFWGIIVSMILDIVDWFVISFGKLEYEDYHVIDKPLDYLQYIFLIPLVYNTPIFEAYVLLLAWRTIGQVLFSQLKSSKIFVLFPNFAEYLALLYFYKIQFFPTLELSSPTIVFGLILFKLFQESWIHLRKVKYTWDWGYNLRKIILNETGRQNISSS